VLQGNGADVAQHCIPPVSQPRMSLTLRCMAPNHAARVAAEVRNFGSSTLSELGLILGVTVLN
jgi:hypothetical protein